MKKEYKIGIMGIAALIIIYFGLKFLKGQDITNQFNYYYIEYNDVDRLQKSAPVYIRGFKVGAVNDIFLKVEDMKTIVVLITVRNDLAIPKDAVAEIITTGLTGGKAIRLLIDKPCSGDDCAQNEDYLIGVTKGLLGSMAGPGEVKKYTTELEEGLKDVLDALSEKLKDNDEMSEEVDNIKAIITNLKSTTASLDRVMTASSGAIKSSLTNIESITTNIKDNNEKISNILNNADAFSDQLKATDLTGTVDEAKHAISNIKNTLETADKTIAKITTLIDNINAGEGSLGKLVTDNELYDKLKEVSINLDLLLEDIRIHPKRYTRVLSKKEIPYQK